MGALLCLKSKYGPGGEYEPDWSVVITLAILLHTHVPHRKPPGGGGCPDGNGGPHVPPDTAILVSAEEPAKPAWRNVRERRKSRRQREREEAAAEVGAPPPDSHASWVSWKRMCTGERLNEHDLLTALRCETANPLLVPSPAPTEHLTVIREEQAPAPPGLFGPRSPHDSWAERS